VPEGGIAFRLINNMFNLNPKGVYTYMGLTDAMIEQLKADLAKAKNCDDLMGRDGAIKKLMAKTPEQMLESELTEHLGYEKYSPAEKNSGNICDGKTSETLKKMIMEK